MRFFSSINPLFARNLQKTSFLTLTSSNNKFVPIIRAAHIEQMSAKGKRKTADTSTDLIRPKMIHDASQSDVPARRNSLVRNWLQKNRNFQFCKRKRHFFQIFCGLQTPPPQHPEIYSNFSLFTFISYYSSLLLLTSILFFFFVFM